MKRREYEKDLHAAGIKSEHIYKLVAPCLFRQGCVGERRFIKTNGGGRLLIEKRYGIQEEEVLMFQTYAIEKQKRYRKSKAIEVTIKLKKMIIRRKNAKN
ncbi:MAG: hypothetical protein ACLRRQ_12360 [Lachnospira pectinoschiza]